MAASGSCFGVASPVSVWVHWLLEYLISEIKAAGVPMTFMHDNAPCHKSDAVTCLLAQENV
jgi:hypothetical protein